MAVRSTSSATPDSPALDNPALDELTRPLTMDCAPSRTPIAPTGRPGDSVGGRYRLENLLEAGGMGAVWRAHDQVTDEPVALKELGGGHLGDALREAKAAETARHPGVIGMRRVLLAAQVPWLVMELVPGPSLARTIRLSGRLDQTILLDVATQLLEAVSAVHGSGLVHHDVTPGNVLRTPAGRVVLADFGLAGRLDDCSAPAAQFLGSPPYVAPETARDGSCGPATDLFATGATLFAAAEGRRAFDAATPAATMRALVEAPIPPMPHAGALEPLIRGLLQKDPAQRLTAPEALEMLG